MPPEHEQLEADWLADELNRCAEYARQAYKEPDDAERRLYLANLVGTLDTLYSHFRVEDGPAPTHTQQYTDPEPNRGSWFGFKR